MTNKTLRTVFRHLGVILFYSILTVVFTYPLIYHLKDTILGGLSDNLYFAWLTGWYEQSLFGGVGHPFFNANMNWPEGWNLSTTDTSLASVFPAAVFSKFWGPIAGFNLAMMLNFVLSGWAMYCLVRYLTRSEGASLIAGTIFAFLPYHVAHFLIGHLSLTATHWFPLFYLGLIVMLRGEQKGWWQYALMAAVTLGLIGFTTMYYLYMVLIVTVIFVFIYLIFTRFKVVKTIRFWKQVGIFLVISIPLLYASMRYFFNLASSGTITSRDWQYASKYSASPTDFLLPSTSHFLFGEWVGQNFNRDLWPEATLYLGFVAIVLGIFAVIWRKRIEDKALVWAAVFTGIATIVLALGTDLHWNAQQIIIHVPNFLQPLVGASETPFLLPTYWLFNNLPFFDRMRALARFGVYVAIFSTLLAGLGAAVLLAWFKGKRRSLAAAVIFLLVIFDFLPGPHTESLTRIEPRPLDNWLAAQSGDGAVAMYPFERVEEQLNIYMTLVHGKPFIGGLFNANQPPQYTYIKPMMEHFPSPESIDWLRENKFSYIVVDTSAYPNLSEVEAEINRNGLELLTVQEQYQVYGFPK